MSEQQPKIEPPADMRQVATMLRQMYVALVDAGFSEVQAIAIIARSVAGRRSNDD